MSNSHNYKRCTRRTIGVCTGCTENGTADCLYSVLAVCATCGGYEGTLLPECPGHQLTTEQHGENYRQYCAKEGPFKR